jgi:hypothetical protein
MAGGPLVTGIMCFVLMLYIVGLGAIWWYSYEVEFRNVVEHYKDDNSTLQTRYCNFTIEINEGLFQMEYDAEKRCSDGSVFESDDESKLKNYKDICEAKSDKDEASNWCKKNNAVISMVVLGICMALFAVLASLGKLKPGLLACMCFFSFLFGMIAMSVYASQKVAFWVTEQDSALNPIYSTVDHVYNNLGDRTDFDGHHDSASFLNTGLIQYRSTDRTFHFCFAFIIIGWILSLIAACLSGIREQAQIQVVNTQTNVVEGGQVIATEMK